MRLAKKVGRFGRLVRRLRFPRAWEPLGDGFIHRKYATYASYLAHQRSKLKLIDLSRYEVEYRKALRDRLQGLEFLQRGASVLCLAARLGTEVRSFLDVGCFAVGLDINPGRRNRFVVNGDFHHIQFADASVDVVFTNSVDHSYDVGAMLGEVRRILKPSGRLVIEAALGSRLGKGPRFYESLWWSDVDALIGLIERYGFRLARRASIQVPWPGEQLVFETAVPPA